MGRTRSSVGAARQGQCGRCEIEPLFTRGPAHTTRIVFFVILSLLLMTADHRYPYLERVRAGLTLVIEPLRWLVDLPYAAAGRLVDSVSSYRGLLAQNQDLKQQNFLLKAQLQKYAALEAENMRLRELLESSFKVGDRVLIAELRQVNMEPFTRQIVLNKGSEHAVYKGQPLVDADGVIGQIVHVAPYSSTAMLITDPSHALPIQVNRNGLRAIAVGTTDPDSMELLHVANNAAIEPGDLLVTSGLGGRFPPGYPVARVTQVENDTSAPFARVLAKPTARLQRTREVLLVWPAAQTQSTPAPRPAEVEPASE